MDFNPANQSFGGSQIYNGIITSYWSNMLEKFQSNPKANYEDMFYEIKRVQDFSKLLSLSKEYSCVKTMLEFNKEHLIMCWYDLFFHESNAGDAVAFLKAIVEIVPQFDMNKWTSMIIESLETMRLTDNHKNTLEFLIELAAKQNDKAYHELYSKKIEDILSRELNQPCRFEILLNGHP